MINHFSILMALLVATGYGSAAMIQSQTLQDDVTLPNPRDVSQGNYLISASKMTQSQAISYCNNNGERKLVALESIEENTEVQNILDTTAFDSGIVGNGWTGGSPWAWNGGSSPEYVWLSTGEPVLVQHIDPSTEAGLIETEWAVRAIAMRQYLLPGEKLWVLEHRTTLNHAICER